MGRIFSKPLDSKSKNFSNYFLFSSAEVYRQFTKIVLIQMLLGRLHIKKHLEPLRSPLSDWITRKNFQLFCYVGITYKFGNFPLWLFHKRNLLREKVCQGPWIHICKWVCTSGTWYWKLLIARHLLNWAYQQITGRQMTAV